MSVTLLVFLKKAANITMIYVTMIGVIFISQLIIQNAKIPAKSPIRLLVYLVAMTFGILVLIVYYLSLEAIIGDKDNKKQVIISTLVISIVGIIIGAIKLQTNQTLGITLLSIFIPLIVMTIIFSIFEPITSILYIGIILLITGTILIVLKSTGFIQLIEFIFIGSTFSGIGSIAIIVFFLHRLIYRDEMVKNIMTSGSIARVEEMRAI